MIFQGFFWEELILSELLQIMMSLSAMLLNGFDNAFECGWNVGTLL